MKQKRNKRKKKNWGTYKVLSSLGRQAMVCGDP